MKSALALLLMTVAAVLPAQKRRSPPVEASFDPADVSGQYEFLHEEEALQLTVQPGNEKDAEQKVTGFISRHGDSESDRGILLDHWIKDGTLRSHELRFRTSMIHGVWFEFDGRVQRGPGTTRSARGYYVIRGKLTEHALDREKHDSARSREVEFNSQPEDVKEQ